MALPTLFVAAANDQFCPPSVMKSAATRIPAAKVSILAGASHSVYYEQPAVWTEAVLEFVDTVSRYNIVKQEA